MQVSIAGPKGRVVVIGDASDIGAQILAIQIAEILREAKFEAVIANVGGIENPGEFLMRRKDKPPPPHWFSVGRYFAESGIVMTTAPIEPDMEQTIAEHPDWKFDDESIMIFISRKL